MRHVSVISGYLISTGFRGLTGCQRDPRKLGRHIINMANTFSKDSKIYYLLFNMYGDFYCFI